MTDVWRSVLYPLGLLSSMAFGLRFVVQWWASEKQKRSVVIPFFWKLSITGNTLLFIHSIIQVHFPICLIQALQSVLAWRNLNLLKPKDEHLPFPYVIVLLVLAALFTIGCFFLQGHLLGSGLTEWLRSPHSLGSEHIPREIPLYVHFLGMLGVGALSLRFWIQWWQAEQSQKSELKKPFWWLGFFGALFSMVYFFLLVDWVNLIGPVLAIIPYMRNLFLIYSFDEKKEKLTPNKAPPEATLSPDIFIFAGEASGDLYGAKLIEQLRKEIPQAEFFGVGGPKMRLAGLELLYPMERFRVMGFSDVLKALPMLIRSMLHLKKVIMQRRPQLCLFIDQPDFGIRLAKKLRAAQFAGKIVQFVAPSVWAYKKKRADVCAKNFDLLLTLFSFEPAHFAHTPLKTVWAGHPLVEAIENGQNTPHKEAIVSIFPGSRPAEILRNLPNQLEAACLFCQDENNAQNHFEIAISVASSAFLPEIQAVINKMRRKTRYDGKVQLVPFDERYSLMQKSSFALAKSGTVTLELALHQVPTIVTYTLTRLNRFIAKNILKLDLPFYCIVNILKQKEVFVELIKAKTEAKDILEALLSLHIDEPRKMACKKECKELFSLLQGEKKPIHTACDAILTTINET